MRKAAQTKEYRAPMREKIRQQLPIVEPAVAHPHASELDMMAMLIAERPEIIDLVYEDLIRGLDDPDKGRHGMMTAEQVFKALTTKQMNGYSYQELAWRTRRPTAPIAASASLTSSRRPRPSSVTSRSSGPKRSKQSTACCSGWRSRGRSKRGARSASTAPWSSPTSITPPTHRCSMTVCACWPD